MAMGLGLSGGLGSPLGKSSAATAAAANDPYFSYVTALFHLSDLTDKSKSGLVATNSGAILLPSSPDGGGVAYFNGALPASISVASPGSATKFPGDFFVEISTIFLSTSASPTILDTRGATGISGISPCLDSSGRIIIYHSHGGIGGVLAQSSFIPATGIRYRIACGRSGSTVYLFCEGNLIATASSATNYSDGALWLGVNNSAGYYLTGGLSELRITNGLCRATSNYAPPSSLFLNQ